MDSGCELAQCVISRLGKYVLALVVVDGLTSAMLLSFCFQAQTVGSEEFVVRRLMRFRCSGGCGRSTGRELSVCAEDYKAQVLEAIVEAGTLTGYWIRRASRTEGQPACVTCTKCP
ncbi:putative toxoplasma gondii family B protein, partial [Toxoplasma gondii RUB]